VVGNLMMAAREHTECVNRSAKEGRMAGSTEEDDWTRVMVGYLVLLCTWLWDSPKTVKEFLSESANLQVVSSCDQKLGSELKVSSYNRLPKLPVSTRLSRACPHSCSEYATSLTANQGRSLGKLSISSSLW
jgi:hypothetical protein